jgi:hypothetical protein
MRLIARAAPRDEYSLESRRAYHSTNKPIRFALRAFLYRVRLNLDTNHMQMLQEKKIIEARNSLIGVFHLECRELKPKA